MNHSEQTRSLDPYELDHFVRRAHAMRAEYTAELFRNAGRAIARGIRGAVAGVRDATPRSRPA